jgi:hypothetical protein
MERSKRLLIECIALIIFSILALGIPVWGEESKTDRREIRIGPDISEFTCESLTGGYNILLFNGCVNCRLRVRIQVTDTRGLDSVEIKFRGNRVFHALPGGDTYRRTDLDLDLSPFRPPGSGAYTLEARAVNRLGAATSKSLTLNMDLQRPTITVVRPTDGATICADIRTADITFEIRATDDSSGIKKVSVIGDRLHDPSWRGEDITSPYSITIRNVDLGTWSWRITAEDNAGNITERSVSINVRSRPAMKK